MEEEEGGEPILKTNEIDQKGVFTNQLLFKDTGLDTVMRKQDQQLAFV